MRRFALSALLGLALQGAQSVIAQDERGLDAWHLDYLYNLVQEQLDPIVSPNAQSSHMHRVLGASNFAAAYNFEELSSSACTTAGISVDHSSYWAPQLYWILDPASPSNTSFLQLSSFNRFYYFLGRNDDSQPVQAWPEGFKMLAGDPNSKSPNPIYTYYCHRKADLTDDIAADNFNFDDPCIGGIKFDLTFPSCWDGINLYKSDQSHMAYPTHGLRDGACPVSHPIRLPSILLEYTYHPESFPAITQGKNMSGNLAWANGDTTGYGLHGDFMMGWDRAILTKALNDPGCVTLGYSITIQSCPTLAPYLNIAAAQNCKPARGQLQEPYAQGDGNVVPRLPGCNLLWASGPKPTCSPPVPGLDVSNFLATAGPNVLPASQQLNQSLPTGQGWHDIGCFNNALTTTISYTDPAMTPERCQDSCKKNGYTYTGLSIVGGFQCICTNTFDESAGITLSGCDTACPVGNSTCGGQYRQDTYYQEAKYVGTDPAVYDLGCYKLPYDWSSDALVKGATYTFTSSSMTRDVCSQACVQKGAAYSAVRDTSCYCGPNLTTGPGFYVPNDMCTRKCGGNSSEICGDYYLMSVGNLANYDKEIVNTLPPNTGYRGCFAEGNGKLALQAYTTSNAQMTVPLCKSYCNQLGYSLAGLRNGNQCYCDNVFNGGQLLPDSQCSMPCAGNATQFCGAPYILSMYNSNATTYGAAQATAAHDAGWQGCYAASLVQSKSAYANYTYTSNDMTKDFCKATCSYFGYSYAAIWAGYSCNCGNTYIGTNRAPDANCNVACRGNNATLCGGSNNIDVYQVSKANVPDTTAMVAKGWLGCYANPSTGTPLSEYTYSDNKMTPQLCQTACQQVANYKYSAVTGTQCTCGNTNAGTLVTPLTCKTPCNGDSTQNCGGSYVASVFNTTVGTSSPTTTGKPAGWFGCYKEGSGYRALSSYTVTNSLMTSALCRKACAIRGYSVAGTEYGSQCYCGNNLYSSGVLPALSCNMPCGGAANETCGAGSILDVYNTTGVVTTADPKTGSYGCFADYGSLNGYKYTSSLMSAHLCAATCKGKGYALSATNSGSTCVCGDASALPTLTVNPDSSCNTKCAGTTGGEMCGGPYTINLYSTSIAAAAAPSGGSSSQPGFLGCYNEGSSRVLSSYTYSSNTLTNPQCIVSCGNLGFKYAGSEFATQCYCSNTIDTSTGGGILQAPTDCSMPCAGNSSDVCGNSGRLTIYETAKTGLITAGNTSTIPGFVGCYAQGNVATSGNYLFLDKLQNAQLCRQSCSYKGFSNAALQGLYCYCNTGSSQVGAIQAMTLCDTPCAGNSTDNCGNTQSSVVALYSTAGVVPNTAGKPAGYVGCFNDNAGARQLPGYSFTSTNMTNLVCATTCAGRGFTLSGTEAGNACYCGASLPYTLLQDTMCNSPCNGASGENCGSAYTLSVYNATQLAATAPKPSTSSVSSTVASSTASGTASKTVSVSGTITTSASSTGSASKTSTSASATSGAADPFATWAARGCIADGSARALNDTSTYDGYMTIPKCAAIAKSGAFKLFGIENGGQCFVGSSLAFNTSATGCNVACPGDASKTTTCGGAWRISLYEMIPLSEAVVTTTTSATSSSTSAASSATLSVGSGTCAAVTVTQTASATVTVTVTGGAAPTSTDKIVKKRRGAAGERGGAFKKYSYIRHARNV